MINEGGRNAGRATIGLAVSVRGAGRSGGFVGFRKMTPQIAVCLAAPIVIYGLSLWRGEETALAAMIALALLTLVPRHVVLGISFSLYMLLPIQAIPTHPVVEHPAYIVFFFWFLRALPSARMPSTSKSRLALGISVAWLSWAFLVAVMRPAATGYSWIIEYAAVPLVLLVPGAARRDGRRLFPFFVFAASSAAMYAVFEFAAKHNPIYDPIYAAHGLSYVGRWSIYRSHAFFGHPLYASTFFAVAFSAIFAAWLRDGRRSHLVSAVVCALAMATTVSRGAALASFCGALLALLITAPAGSRGRKMTSAISGLIAAAVLAETVLGSRSGSVEGQSSAAVRQDVIAIAWRAVKASHYVGWGPGSAQNAVLPYDPQRYVLENSFLQILVGIGVIGLMLFVLLGASLCVGSARRGNAIGAAAILAFYVSILGYNAVDAAPTISILFAIATLFCISFGENNQATVADQYRTPASRSSTEHAARAADTSVGAFPEPESMTQAIRRRTEWRAAE